LQCVAACCTLEYYRHKGLYKRLSKKVRVSCSELQ